MALITKTSAAWAADKTTIIAATDIAVESDTLKRKKGDGVRIYSSLPYMKRLRPTRATAEKWLSLDPILADGEFVLETDTRKYKIGDGVKKYSELEYGGADIDNTLDPATASDNKAASAGVVARRMVQIESDSVSILSNSIDLNIDTTLVNPSIYSDYQGYGILNANGTISTNASYRVTNLIPDTEGYIEVTLKSFSSNVNHANFIVLNNNNKAVISKMLVGSFRFKIPTGHKVLLCVPVASDIYTSDTVEKIALKNSLTSVFESTINMNEDVEFANKITYDNFQWNYILYKDGRLLANSSCKVTNAIPDTEGYVDVTLSSYSSNAIYANFIVKNKSDDIVISKMLVGSFRFKIPTGHKVLLCVPVASDIYTSDTVEKVALKKDVENKVDSKIGKNILNEDVIRKGYTNTSNAWDGYNANWIATYGNIDLLFGNNETITVYGCATGGFYTHYFNSAGDKILSFKHTGLTHTFNKSDAEGAVKIIVTLNITKSELQAEYSATLSPYEKYNELGGYNLGRTPKHTILTANSDPNSDADFKGNNAIQEAIDSITDANYYNRYTIECTGSFHANKISDYVYYPGSALWFFITGKNYISLDGVYKGNCILRGELSPVLTEVQADTPSGAEYSFVKASYGLTILVQWNCTDATFENFICTAKNIRYPFHTDGSSGACKNFDNLYRNCDFYHEGKEGDSIGTIGGSASGFGIAENQTMFFDNCNFNTGQYCHTNKNFKRGSLLKYNNCNFFPSEPKVNRGMAVVCMDSGVVNFWDFTRCNFHSNSWISLESSLYNSSLPIAANIYDIKINAKDISPMPICEKSIKNGLALRIRSLSVDTTSKVRVSETSSAFACLFGDSSLSVLYENERFRKSIHGYEYRDGGQGLQGEAIGMWNVTENAISGTSVSLASRLGDCSTNNKVLQFTIDGESKTLTFNQNYTSMTNAEILESINNVVSAYCIFDTYNIAGEWYPEFKDVEYATVDPDATQYIHAGMGVVCQANAYYRRAKNSDGYIDGIALNTAAAGGQFKIMKSGRTTISNYFHKIFYNGSVYYALPENAKFGISETTDGEFVVDQQPYVLKKKYNDSVEII